MAFLTSKDDNSVGEALPLSTGSPTNTGATFLSDADGPYRYMRFSYASTAINGFINGGIWHCQFLNCGTAIQAEDTDTPLHNVLFSNCGTAVGNTSNDSFSGEHVTADRITTLWQNPYSNNAKLTNSILTGVTNIGANVALYYCKTNATGNGIYQTVGAASYLLANGSTNRDSGTTNINATLLSDLLQMTTYPPVALTNGILSPQAQRDTNTPDLGYHYSPIDYYANGLTITNTLTLTNGVVLATYGASTSYGISLSGSGKLISGGTPKSLNYIVRYNTVQEQSDTNWSSSTVGPSVKLAGANASAQCRFTGWSVPSGVGDHFYTTFDSTLNSFRDCQFTGGKFTVWPGLLALTNCLFERVLVSTKDNGNNDQFYLFNNLFRGGTLAYQLKGATPIAFARDNMFDNTAFTASGASYSCSNNAYITNQTRLTNDTAYVILTNNPAYQVGPLGNYYYPTNDGMLSTLINKGSRYSFQAGLYHYTTTTNNLAKDDGTLVDIGFHHVAVDANGNPIDSDNDGLPDYFEDSDSSNSYYPAFDISDLRNPDTDGDGLLDGWEYYHGFNPQVSNAGGVIWWTNATGQISTLAGITNAIALAAGANHGLLLQEGGTVVAWGSNTYGQINVPTGLNNCLAIAAGDNHSLALKNNNTVIAWGRTNASQTTVPSGLTNVIAIAAGGDQSLALLSNGSVTNWGATNVGTMPAGLTNFGGSNYSNTPVGAVSHTHEPLLPYVNDPAVYIGLWASGKPFAICAWGSRRTQFFQAVGDPFVRR